jgi:antitoxin CptB
LALRKSLMQDKRLCCIKNNSERRFMNDTEILRKRLLYQSQHRGMREMDWLLGGFAQKHIRAMSAGELHQFEALLAFTDQDLYGWFFEKMPIPDDAPQDLVTKVAQTIQEDRLIR